MGGQRSLSRGGRILVALAMGGALFGIATAVQADIPDAGVIHSCYDKVNGQLRVIDSDKGGRCVASEIPLSWSQSGPTGPTGATGATGPTGPTGPKGATGPSPTLSVYEADGPFETIPAGGVKGLGADCKSTGDLATGGGFNVGSAIELVASIRNSNNSYSWLVIAFNPTSLDVTGQATVECLRTH